MRLTLATVPADRGTELDAAIEALGLIALRGKVVTGDALHCNRRTVAAINAGGGDWCLAMAYMLKRQDGFCLFLDDGRVDIDSNLVENAIRSPAMNRRNALFAGHDEGGRNWARYASLIGTCKMNGVEPYAYLRDLFTKLANGHLARDIDALMPWAYTRQAEGS